MIWEFLDDPRYSEVILQGPHQVIYESMGKFESHPLTWPSKEASQNFFQEVIANFVKAPSFDYPISSGEWKKFRVQIITPPLTKHEYLIHMRRLNPPNDIKKLEADHWKANQSDIDLLEHEIKNMKSSFLIVGPTGVGKTTFLQGILNTYIHKERVVILEDTEELEVPNSLSSSLKTYDSSCAEIPDVDLDEIVKASLRMYPQRIILGEMRGAEAANFLLVLSTGHEGSGATLHARDAQDALHRLEMLTQMGSTWMTETIRKVIYNSLKIIIVLGIDAEGRRFLKGVSKITGLEQTGFLLEEII